MLYDVAKAILEKDVKGGAQSLAWDGVARQLLPAFEYLEPTEQAKIKDLKAQLAGLLLNSAQLNEESIKEVWDLREKFIAGLSVGAARGVKAGNNELLALKNEGFLDSLSKKSFDPSQIFNTHEGRQHKNTRVPVPSKPTTLQSETTQEPSIDAKTNKAKDVTKPLEESFRTSTSKKTVSVEIPTFDLNKLRSRILEVARPGDVTHGMDLISFGKLSGTAVLTQIFEGSTELVYYIGHIPTNLVVSGPVDRAEIIFDAADLCLVNVSRYDEHFLVSVDKNGVVHEYVSEKGPEEIIEYTDKQVKTRSGKIFETESGMEFTAIPTVKLEDGVLTSSAGGGTYLIRNSHGTTLGFTLRVDLNDKDVLIVDSIRKIFLVRKNVNIAVVRDMETDTEQLFVAKPRLIFDADDVEVLGGCVFIAPDLEEYKETSVSTFIPQQLRFGDVRTLTGSLVPLRKKPSVYLNGVFFPKEKTLFVDNGSVLKGVREDELEEGLLPYVFLKHDILTRNFQAGGEFHSQIE